MKSSIDRPSTVIPWYVESEFGVLAKIGPASAAQAYCVWRRRTDEAIAVARSRGCDVQLMPVTLSAFREWLARERRQDDAASRRAFVIACAAVADFTIRREASTSFPLPAERQGFRLH